MGDVQESTTDHLHGDGHLTSDGHHTAGHGRRINRSRRRRLVATSRWALGVLTGNLMTTRGRGAQTSHRAERQTDQPADNAERKIGRPRVPRRRPVTDYSTGTTMRLWSSPDTTRMFTL